MKQFTMNMDEGLLQAAKRHALEQGRTVSDIVRETLAREVGWNPDAASPMADEASTRTALRDYSKGRLTRRQAMDAIGLTPDRYGAFVEMMTESGTAWPQMDRKQVDAEGDVVVQAIFEGLDED